MEQSLAKRIALYACVGQREIKRLKNTIRVYEEAMLAAFERSGEDYDIFEKKYGYQDVHVEKCFVCNAFWIGETDSFGMQDPVSDHFCMEMQCYDTRNVCHTCLPNSTFVGCVRCKVHACPECFEDHTCK